MKQKWHGTALTVQNTTKDTLKRIYAKVGDRYYEEEEDGIVLYNHPLLLINEAEFIEETHYFNDTLQKLQKKTFSQEMEYFSKSRQRFISFSGLNEKSFGQFATIMEERNLKTFGIDENLLNIPPEFFHHLYHLYQEYENEEKQCLMYLANIFSLMAISDKTRFESEKEDDRKMVFHFITGDKHKRIVWREWGSFDDFQYYEDYQLLMGR